MKISKLMTSIVLGVAFIQAAHAYEMTAQETLVREYLSGFENRDIKSIASTLHDDVIQEMPYWIPEKVVGKKALIEFFSSVKKYKSIKFVDVEFTRLQDETKVLVEFKGRVKTADDIDYNNTYINIFHIKEGKIIYIKEYFNPAIVNEAFASSASD